MQFLNKKLFSYLTALLMASTVMAQQQLTPFVDWKKSNPNWDMGDTSQVGYVGSRCSALLLATSAFFIENPGRPEDLLTGLKMAESSETFQVVAERLAVSRRMSKEVLASRKEALLDIYLKKLKENRRLHNNMFHEPMLGDMTFCKQTEPLFNQLSKTLK